uniref:NADH dehydrogenase subunit 2 n=1 Tax=Diplonema sp. ATCC 50224 TaxID=91375 RepID=A0A2D2AJV2_9EUGL|nr:hypothetical protein [Diplonema sp. ATCC 50224]
MILMMLPAICLTPLHAALWLLIILTSTVSSSLQALLCCWMASIFCYGTLLLTPATPVVKDGHLLGQCGWLLISLLSDMLLIAMAMVLAVWPDALISLVLIKALLIPSTNVAIAMYSSASKESMLLAIVCSYVILIVLLPSIRFFFFFFFFFGISQSALAAMHFLLDVATMEVVAIATTITSTLSVGAVLTTYTIASTIVYLLVVSSMCFVVTMEAYYLWCIPCNSGSIRGLCRSTPSELAIASSLVVYGAGLPVTWYAVAKTEVLCIFMMSYVSFFFFFLMLVSVLWVFLYWTEALQCAEHPRQPSHVCMATLCCGCMAAVNFF